MNKNFAVVTTINSPTKAIEVLYEKFGENLIIVADEKTPKDWNYKNVIPIETVVDKPYAPTNHYARKNLGYMHAIRSGAELVYDTDDDNIPNENWYVRSVNNLVGIANNEGWQNVYNHFTDKKIWPRGFSLLHLQNNNNISYDSIQARKSSIQQGLSDGEPDVDAIWRLTSKLNVSFKKNRSVYLKKNTWCPFNSQSTWFFPKAYPLLYLPVYSTFRMTDIWRSFISQRCLWEIGEGVTFHSPSEVFQDRNEHDLLKDFEDEIPGYLKNDLIVEILSDLKLKQGEEDICHNLLACYDALVRKDILPSMEINSVKEWIKDYNDIVGNI